MSQALPNAPKTIVCVMDSMPTDLLQLQNKIWNGSIHLEIDIAKHESRSVNPADSYIIQIPRLSYLPLILPRLHQFFHSILIDPEVCPSDGWFSYENIPLKWHYPLGLLYDIYATSDATYLDLGDAARGLSEHQLSTRQRPFKSGSCWKLTVHFHAWPVNDLIKLDKDGQVLQDAFMNSVKEADFLRNGTAKSVMSLGKDDSKNLWTAVEQHNVQLFNVVYQKLLHFQGSKLRHIPLRVYMPDNIVVPGSSYQNAGSLRVLQSLLSSQAGSRQTQTIGSALNSMIPSLFPSQRRTLVAEAILHGAILPLNTPLADLLKVATFADGWLHVVIQMIG